MNVFLATLDPALQELFGMTPSDARLRLERELVLATLFSNGIQMPDVFLYNNPALHAHILGPRRRSLFSELLDANVVQIRARTSAVDYSDVLDAVTTDTLAGVPLSRAVAIQTTAERVTERLAGVASNQKFGIQPTVGKYSSGERFAQLILKHTDELSRSGDQASRRVGKSLQRFAALAEKRLEKIDGAGIRRAVVIWQMAEHVAHGLSAQTVFLDTPYGAILLSARVSARDLLRRQMLEVTYAYLSNLARLYQANLLWPDLGRTRVRPDLAQSSGGAIDRLIPWQGTWFSHTVSLPTLRRLRHMRGDLVALRGLGHHYLDDLKRIETGDGAVSIQQVKEDLEDYARNIRRYVNGTPTSLTQAYTVASGALAAAGVTGGPGGAAAGGASGLFTMLSVLASGRSRQRITVYKAASI